jgi:hypothetical protein
MHWAKYNLQLTRWLPTDFDQSSSGQDSYSTD